MPVIPALAFICLTPAAVDGDTLRCANRAELVRLQAIDAPELPGHCRRGRVCTEGDGAASRAALKALVKGKAVSCTARHRDTYGRLLARCSAEGLGDLSCAMVARGFAIERYARLRCGR